MDCTPIKSTASRSTLHRSGRQALTYNGDYLLDALHLSWGGTRLGQAVQLLPDQALHLWHGDPRGWYGVDEGHAGMLVPRVGRYHVGPEGLALLQQRSAEARCARPAEDVPAGWEQRVCQQRTLTGGSS